MLSVQLASRFLFYTGFHTKKTLRGTATDWYDIVCHHLRSSKAVRSWFANEVLFNHPHRYQNFSKYTIQILAFSILISYHPQVLRISLELS